MSLSAATYVEGQTGAGQDRAAVIDIDGGLVAIVADGAGGLGGGAEAAEAIVRGVSRRVRGQTPDMSALIRALVELDGALLDDPDCGEAAAVVVGLVGDRIVGASAGDCGAWLAGPTVKALTAEQVRRPMLGSGGARVVGFDAPFEAGTVLLGSDGYGRHRSADDLTQTASPTSPAPPSRLLARLVDGVRLRDGTLADDVALVLLRRVPTPARPSTASTPRRAAPRPVTPTAGARLLFADRNGGFVRSVGRAFLGGFELVVAETGTAALSLAAAGGFAAVLVDEALGDMTGPELVTALRGEGYDGPVVAISARGDRNAQMLTAGADAACSKMEFGRIAAVLKGLGVG